MESSVYPHNNWELASARALAVLNFFTNELRVPTNERRFTVMAYSEYSEGQRMIDIVFRPQTKR